MSSNGASTSTLLDTSSAGYSRNGNTLTLTSLDGSSEGLYQCVYTTGRTCELCIYVFGKVILLIVLPSACVMVIIVDLFTLPGA